MKRAPFLTGSCLLLALGLSVGCGGSKPPEAAPKPDPTPKAEPPKTEPEPEAKKPETPAEKPAPKEETRVRKPAKDILLVPGWDFVLQFRESELKDKVEADCTKKSKGDEDAARACVTAASAEAANDRLKFATDDKGGWWFIYMGKNKGKEILYTKLQFKLAKDEPDKLVLTPVGKDQGKAPIKKLPAEIVVEMPDEYNVIVQHPDKGKLVFAVKVTGDSGPKPVEEAKPEDKKKDEKKK